MASRSRPSSAVGPRPAELRASADSIERGPAVGRQRHGFGLGAAECTVPGADVTAASQSYTQLSVALSEGEQQQQLAQQPASPAESSPGRSGLMTGAELRAMANAMQDSHDFGAHGYGTEPESWTASPSGRATSPGGRPGSRLGQAYSPKPLHGSHPAPGLAAAQQADSPAASPGRKIDLLYAPGPPSQEPAEMGGLQQAPHTTRSQQSTYGMAYPQAEYFVAQPAAGAADGTGSKSTAQSTSGSVPAQPSKAVKPKPEPATATHGDRSTSSSSNMEPTPIPPAGPRRSSLTSARRSHALASEDPGDVAPSIAAREEARAAEATPRASAQRQDQQAAGTAPRMSRAAAAAAVAAAHSAAGAASNGGASRRRDSGAVTEASEPSFSVHLRTAGLHGATDHHDNDSHLQEQERGDTEPSTSRPSSARPSSARPTSARPSSRGRAVPTATPALDRSPSKGGNDGSSSLLQRSPSQRNAAAAVQQSPSQNGVTPAPAPASTPPARSAVSASAASGASTPTSARSSMVALPPAAMSPLERSRAAATSNLQPVRRPSSGGVQRLSGSGQAPVQRPGRRSGTPLDDEEDPAVVLQQSLEVLSEIEGLIHEAVGLGPEEELEDQPPEVMARVPTELLSALEDTLEIIMMAREDLAAREAASSRGGRPGSGSGAAGAGGAPGGYYYSSGYRAAKAGFSAFPEPSQLYTIGTNSRARALLYSYNTKAAASGRSSGGRPVGAPPSNAAAAGSPAKRPSSSGRAQRLPALPAADSPSASATLPTARAREAALLRGGNPTASGGWSAVDSSKRAWHREAPPGDWLERKRAQAAAERRRREEQVAADLRFLEQVRARTGEVQQQHELFVAQAEASVEAARSAKAVSEAQQKWLDYQDTVTERSKNYNSYSYHHGARP